MLIDSHCNINFANYKEDGDDVIRRSLDKNIWLVNIGSQYTTSERSVKIAERYDDGVNLGDAGTGNETANVAT